MARTFKRLVGPIQLANAAATVYTVPASTKTMIRHIHISNPTVNARLVTISIGTSAAATRIYDAYSVAAGTALDFFCMYIVDATEIVQAFADAATSVVMVINGEESTP